MMSERERENTRPDPVEEAGETTAADYPPPMINNKPVGEGSTVEVEGEVGAS
jgi:hypothetical protein